MRFGAHVKVITRDGICMLGNTENGCIIGIDDDARALCERLCNEDIDSSELNEMDPFLRGAVRSKGFFQARDNATKAGISVYSRYVALQSILSGLLFI